MQPIPIPRVLDPDHFLDDNRIGGDGDRAERVEAALRETCTYGRQLWESLAAVRSYLMASLPPDPRRPGGHPPLGASPTGPDDEAGWTAWTNAYAAVTSALCGPHGDSGFGAGEAREAARQRRTAPNVKVLARTSTPPDEHAPDHSGRLLRSVGVAAVTVLALRGSRRPGTRFAGGRSS